MSEYNYNLHSISPPVGFITSYIGTTDPEGWIICDGITRYANDYRFSSLAVLLNTTYSVNTNTGNQITPPDLRGKYIYGSSKNPNNNRSMDFSSEQDTDECGCDNKIHWCTTNTTSNNLESDNTREFPTLQPTMNHIIKY